MTDRALWRQALRTSGPIRYGAIESRRMKTRRIFTAVSVLLAAPSWLQCFATEQPGLRTKENFMRVIEGPSFVIVHNHAIPFYLFVGAEAMLAGILLVGGLWCAYMAVRKWTALHGKG